MLRFLTETILLGLKNLRLHKLRSLLTALGIIFGVAAVIIMVAIGEGTKQAALEQIRQLGARNVLVRSIRPPESTEASGRMQRTLDYGLKDDTDLARLVALQQDFPGLLTHVVPLRNTEQKVVRGDIRVQANAIGTVPEIFHVINLKLAAGQLFTEAQSRNQERVCVIGATVARQLFPFEDPLGKTIRVGTLGRGSTMLTVIGVLEPVGLRPGSEGANLMGRDLDLDVYFPLTAARETFGNVNMLQLAGSMERKQIELSEVWLQAGDTRDVEKLASVVENIAMLPQGGRGGGWGRPRDDVEVRAPISILRNAERLNRMFNFIMVGIASFSLVVGGIGIMNIMLASVTERTREIGIRRALGAKRRHITMQFLVETTVISLTGGLIGIGLGCGIAAYLERIVHFFAWLFRSRGPLDVYPTDIAAWSVIGSFVVSGLIGVGFGLYPAVHAARLDPIEALRHE